MRQMSLKPDFVKGREIRWKEKLQQIKSLSKRRYKVTIDATGKVASVTLVKECNGVLCENSISQLHGFLPKSRQ